MGDHHDHESNGRRLPIRLDIEPDRVAVLTLDHPDSGANVFDATALRALARHLDQLETTEDLRGLILHSAKRDFFSAGADIQQFHDTHDEESIRRLVREGQQLFHRVSLLPVPTVSAIHGACVGGGCEISLACDYRLASRGKRTKIGLPEIKLGILPGWGGCVRLPRVVGAPAALDMILGGKTWPAPLARKRGLVDQCVPREHLLRIAREWIAKGKRRPRRLWRRNNPVVTAIARRRALAGIQRRTGGHYPAPPLALDTVLDGLRTNVDAALKLEEDAIVHLAQTLVSRNLVRLFFLQESAKKLRVGNERGRRTEHIAVIGAGVMGAGIAQWSSARGFAVMLQDVATEPLARGMKTIEGLYEQAVKRRVLARAEARDGLDRVTPVAGTPSLANCDFIIEAAVERLDVKKRIFADLEQRCGERTVLGTNTSALSITEIAADLADPGRVVGLHYFNPVHRMQLVEIVRGEQTRPETAAQAVRFAQDSGKLPVVVRDRPGFLVNRVLVPYLMEAGRLVERGVTVGAIDQAMLDFGMPMGPLRVLDEIGLDVADHVGRFFADTFPDRVRLPAALAALLQRGDRGRKTGRGFYVHGSGRDRPTPADTEALAEGERLERCDADALRGRLVGLLVNEAARCVEEGVVDGAAEVDLGLVFGAGFAPFRGGPLRHADQVGPARIASDLERLADREGAAFAPCELLADLARTGGTFHAE